jgi:hypothetical protein
MDSEVRKEMEKVADLLVSACKEKISNAETGYSVRGVRVKCRLASRDTKKIDREIIDKNYTDVKTLQDTYMEEKGGRLNIGAVPIESHKCCWVNALSNNPKMFVYWPENVDCDKLQNYPSNRYTKEVYTKFTTPDGERIDCAEFQPVDVTFRSKSTFDKWFKGLAE